jgi:hypothetical protein
MKDRECLMHWVTSPSKRFCGLHPGYGQLIGPHDVSFSVYGMPLRASHVTKEIPEIVHRRCGMGD